jgi:hypothetical protein
LISDRIRREILAGACALFGAALCQAADKADTWTDPNTHLMWTAADNGSGVSLKQAERYCRGLKLAGFQDWALPSIDDLQGIVGEAESQGGYRVKGPIRLTGWQWSSTPGKQDGEGWALDFGDGGRASVAAGDSGLNRALCIRHAKPTPLRQAELRSRLCHLPKGSSSDGLCGVNNSAPPSIMCMSSSRRMPNSPGM